MSLPATNAAATQPTSAVYFNPGADAVAKFVGLDLKIATVIAMPVTKPVKDRPEANVIVVLGQDFNVANVAPTQQLPLQTPAPAVPATPAAAVVQPTTTVKK